MKNFVRILAAVVVLLLGVFLVGVFAPKTAKDEHNQDNAKIRHHILPDEVERAPIAVHVRRYVVFDEAATKDEVGAVLKTERANAIKQYPDVTNLGVYGFASDENARDGMGTWIAMSFTRAPFGDANLQVDETRLTAAWQTPTVRFGLTESERRALFKELVLQEDRANSEADRRYPSHTKADMMARATAANELRERYTKELARDRGIAVDSLQAISVEALTKGWPFPN